MRRRSDAEEASASYLLQLLLLFPQALDLDLTLTPHILHFLFGDVESLQHLMNHRRDRSRSLRHQRLCVYVSSSQLVSFNLIKCPRISSRLVQTVWI